MSEKHVKHDGISDELGNDGSKGAGYTFQLQANRARVVIVAATFALYVAAFFVLHPLMGLAMPALAVLPVAVAGWQLGIRGGLLTGALCFPLNLLLLNTAGMEGWTALTKTAGGASGSILLIFVGGVVGRISDLGRQARQAMTSRLWAETSLRESEALLRTIAANYPNSYLSIIEKDLTVGFTSGQEFKKLNLDPEQFVGMTLEQVFGDQAPVVREHYLKTFAGEEQSFELFINNQNQLYRTVPLYAQDGTIPRILSVVENITKRKQAEETLRESEQRYQLATDASQTAVWQADLLTGQVESGGTLERLIGYEPSEVVGHEGWWLEATHPDDRERGLDAWQDCSKGKRDRYDIEHRIYHKDGSLHWLEIRAQGVRDSEGRIVAIAGTTRDITERKRAEEETRQRNEDLAALNLNARRLAETLDESKVVEIITRICVERFEARLVWLLYAEPDGSLNTIGFFPTEIEYPKKVTIRWDQGPLAEGPTGRAIRSRLPIVFEDLSEIPDYIPWREPALAEGFVTSAAFPLITQRGVIGALNVYSDQPGFFTTERVNLFQTFIHQAAIALENCRLFKAVQQELTERKQVEEALSVSKAKIEESELKFKSITNQATEGIALSDLNGNYRFVNPAFCLMTGYSEAELLTKTVFDMKADTQPPRSFKESTTTKEGMPIEVTLRRKDNTEFNTEIIGKKIKIGGQEYVLGTVRDITERKLAREKLRLSEERFSKAFHTSPAGMTITRNADGKFVDANDAFCRMFEFSREEVIGHTSTEIKMWTAEERKKLIKKQIKSGGLQNFELQVHSKSGRVVNILFSSKEMESEGEMLHVTTMIDISERKRAEASLQKYIAELTILYQSAQRLQILRRPEELSQQIVDLLEKTLSYEYGAVLLVEESSNRLVPFAVAKQGGDTEFVQKDKAFIASQELRVGDGITGWVAEHGQSIRLGDVRQDERYYGLRASIRSELCVPLLAGGKTIGVINVETSRPDAYSEDSQHVLETVAALVSVAIQNARLLEETRQHRNQLADLSRRLVNVHETESRAIGRELHDQMGQILTALKLTLELAPQLPPETAAKKLALAQELASDLLSRVSALSLDLRPPMLDDLGIIPALLWYVNRYEEQTRLEVDFHHSGAEGHRFSAEVETTVYRAVQEALTNVARHAQARHIRIKVHASGEQLEILIEDDGIGFDPQAAFAAHRGLSAMHERVKLLGGSFQIESQPGKGTQELIQLPLKEGA